MAKNFKWENGVLTYNVPGAGDAVLDTSKLGPEVNAAALAFGIQTAARNATAGLFTEDPQAALKRILGRFESWLKGEWKAAAAEGERKTSLLAQAVAEAGGISVEDAATAISDMIEAKVTEAGLDADNEENKAHIRKIAEAVRGAFAEAEGVPAVLARLKAEAAAKRASEALASAQKAQAEGKTGTSLKELLGK